jgi:hypothetical protein
MRALSVEIAQGKHRCDGTKQQAYQVVVSTQLHVDFEEHIAGVLRTCFSQVSRDQALRQTTELRVEHCFDAGYKHSVQDLNRLRLVKKLLGGDYTA